MKDKTLKDSSSQENISDKEQSKHQSEKDKKLNRIKSLFVSVLSLLIALLSTSVLTLLFTTNDSEVASTYFSKDIKNQIVLAIQNDADLDIIKNIYKNKEIKSSSLISRIKGKSEDIYPVTTPLSRILEDIQVDLYLSEIPDSVMLKKIKCTIDLHNQVNPFDKLDQNQKHNFDNIQIKLSDEFSLIQNDVTKIADELHSKNLLVDKYLDKSTTSYWISIIALFTTIVLSIFQLYKNRQSKIVDAVMEALFIFNHDEDEFEKEEEEQEAEK